MIERANSSVVEMMETLEDLLKVLRFRSEQNMMPLQVTNIFHDVTNDGEEDAVTAMRNNLVIVYEYCSNYIKEWSSNMNEFRHFKWMQLSTVPKWESLTDTMAYITQKGFSINEGVLFNEFF